ncbi:MAG: hypothetical protein HYU25_08005 [Candidatus Rokubacteria bacterium]|nr:hypothetical protein [Candidatus Rokubacteria bacterium]
MLRRVALGLCAVLVAGPGGAIAQNEPFQPALQRYYRAVEDICRTGVTPDIVKLYEDARQAVDAAGYGGGRDNNFWGVKPPDRAYNECFQSPSFL